jgi:hypothetical protein
MNNAINRKCMHPHWKDCKHKRNWGIAIAVFTVADASFVTPEIQDKNWIYYWVIPPGSSRPLTFRDTDLEWLD